MNTKEFRRNTRGGIMLIEVVLSMLALTIAGATIVQAIVAVDRARHSTKQFDIASRELENLLTEYSSRPYDELSEATADALTLSDDAATALASAGLTVTVVDEPSPPAKRITAKLSLASPARVKPICLTTWVYAPTPEEPTTDEEANQ